MRAFVDDKYKVILRVMRSESDTKISETVKQALLVPGLIGDNCPYSTLAHFLRAFSNKTEDSIAEHNAKLAALSGRMDVCENRQETVWQEQQQFEKQYLNTILDLRKENGKNTAGHNLVSYQLNNLADRFKPFTKDVLEKLRDIAVSRFDRIEEKVKSLASEVFEEVMEQEMALAKLEQVSLDELPIPQTQMNKERKSLLTRLSTLQLNIKHRMGSGKFPNYFKESGDESSVQSSVIEEELSDSGTGSSLAGD